MTSERAGLPYPEGDAGGLESAAGRLTSLAAAVAGDAADASAAARPAGWVGPAAAAFAALAGTIASHLSTSAHALRSAAIPVRRLAHTLEEAQRQIRGWAREIEEAERAAAQSRGALQSVRTAAAPELLGSNPLAASPLDPHVVAAQHRAAQAQQHVDELRTRYRPKAQSLCDDVDDADRAAGRAVLAAADAAPTSGAAAPGDPRVPGAVRLFAPVFLFHPDELYLPGDAEQDLRNGFPLPHGPMPLMVGGRPAGLLPSDVKRLGGIGAGAPIYYRVRHNPGGGSEIEYWVYHQHNDYRNKQLPEGVHRGDWEGVAVRLDRHGKPLQVGYSQHEGGCSVPFDRAETRRGHPSAYEGLGSGASYPRPGAYDNRVEKLGVDINPYEDLASGQGTGKRIVHSSDNLIDYDHSPLHDFNGQYGGDKHSPQGPHRQEGKFAPGSKTWTTPCPAPAKAGG
jgi:uncharacterized protein YukE